MVSKANLEVLQGYGDSSDQPGPLGLPIELLRARGIEELGISERLDSKGRQVFALSAAFFAVAQTVAFSAFRASSLTSGERILVAALGALAALGLLITGHRLTNAEGPKDEPDIKPSVIEQWARDKSDEWVGRML